MCIRLHSNGSMISYLAQVLPFALSSDAHASYTGAVARASMCKPCCTHYRTR